MNTIKLLTVNKVLSLIFNDELANNKEQLANIHREHLALTGTANFLYKKEVYTVNRYMPVKPLHPNLRDKMASYLAGKETINNAMTAVYTYLSSNLKTKMSSADFYFLLPPCVHPILSTWASNDENLNVEERPKDYDHINEQLEQVMLLKIL